jgi:hypothetical protein
MGQHICQDTKPAILDDRPSRSEAVNRLRFTVLRQALAREGRAVDGPVPETDRHAGRLLATIKVS